MRVSSAGTRQVTGLCLEVNDLALSKYVAGREKDLEFTAAPASYGTTDVSVLRERLRTLNLPDALRAVVATRIAKDARR